MRHGVVENMAPSGPCPRPASSRRLRPRPPQPQQQQQQEQEHPPQQQQQQQQQHPPTPVRIVIKQRANATTPTAPAPVPAETPAPGADETEEEELGDTDEEDLDDDEEMHIGSGHRSLFGRHHSDDGWAFGSAHHIPGRRSISHPSMGRLEAITVDQKYVDAVVELAVNEAIDHYRYPTGYALRMLYDEKSSEPEFVALVARVFQQTASAEDLEEFAKLVHQKKCEGKKTTPDAIISCLLRLAVALLPMSHCGRRIEISSPWIYRNCTSRLRGPPKQQMLPSLADADMQPAESLPAQQDLPEETDQRDTSDHHHEEQQPEIATPVRSSKKRKSRHPDSATKLAPNSANGKSKIDTPSKRRTRRDSQSSSSTLSSARSMSPPEDVFSVPTSRASPIVEDDPAEAPPPPKRRRSNAPRKNGNVSTPEAPPSPAASQSTPAAVAAEPELVPFTMPEAINSPMFPNLNGKKGKGGSKIVFPSKVGTLDENDELSRLRRRAKQATRTATIDDSYTREPVADPTADVVPEPASRKRSSLAAGRSTPAPAPPTTGRTTRSTRKRSHEEAEEQQQQQQQQPSPTVAIFPASEVPSTAANSRAGTLLRGPQRSLAPVYESRPRKPSMPLDPFTIPCTHAPSSHRRNKDKSTSAMDV